MPSSAIVHAAVFTVGAVIGAGAAATITHRRQQRFIPPTVEQKTSAIAVRSIPGDDVLKYGNPGETHPFS